MIKLKVNNTVINGLECVIFDKDGTFIDLHYLWGKITELRALEVINRFKLPNDYLEKLCLSLGYCIKTKKMLSNGITALYSRIKIIELFKNDLIKLGINATEQEITEIFDNVSNNFHEEIPQYIQPINEAIEFIKKIRKKGVKTAIVTSDSVESTNLTIKNFGWENLFDIIVGRESSIYTKESGKPTQLVLQKLNMLPSQTIMIGDAPTDYFSAINAGIENVILVSTGQVSYNELKEISKTTVNSLNEVEIIN